MFRQLAFAAVLAFATPTFATEEEPVNSADIQADIDCVFVGMVLSGTEDSPSLQQAGLMIAVFHIGRLQGRAPTLNLENALLEKIQSVTTETFDADRVRCGTELQSHGAELVRMGHSLRARMAPPVE